MENLRQKYPAPREDDPDLVKDVIASLHNDVSEIPPDVLINHPAELKFMMVSPLVDPSVPKRLVTCILAALRANGKFLKWISFQTNSDTKIMNNLQTYLLGVFGCFIEVSKDENFFNDMYKKLGFTELCPNFLGRCF